jgi:hypothetical protein
METPLSPAEKQRAMVQDLGMTPDEAAHALYDMGDIDSDDHADLLSDEECERIYG